jgi:hypothetical protein
MVPFAGLIIEHQHISNLEVTQQLQKLTRDGFATTKDAVRRGPKFWKYAALAGAFIVGLLTTLYLTRKDFLTLQAATTEGVVRQSTIQKQYALALLVNDYKHWRAVSKNFPPTDGVSRNYYLKAELQIARKAIEGENYQEALEPLMNVIRSQYADDVLTTIARIEMAYVSARTAGPALASEFYDAAARDMKVLESVPEKHRLIRESLPNRIREEWDRNDYSRMEQPQEAKPE